MGHGSRDRDGSDEFASLVEAVAAAAPGYLVVGGMLEFAGPTVPSIDEAMDRCVASGADHILTVPVLLHHAGHSKRDMPAEVARARARHPGVDIAPTAPIGSALDLLDIVEERIHQLRGASAAISPPKTAVLLVGRGSTDPEANAEFFKLGRLLSERLGASLVECCFVSLAGPAVQEGIERCIRLGARRVLVIPYFLSTGLLVKRIATQAAEAKRRHRAVDVVVGEHLGVHPKLVQLILSRVAAGNRSASGGATANNQHVVSGVTTHDSGLVERYALPPAEIEALSMQRVATVLGESGDLREGDRQIVHRMVYATGDPGLAPLIRIHPDAVTAGVAALRAARTVVVDVRMVQVALDPRITDRLGCRVVCALDASSADRQAQPRDVPRTLKGMRALASELDGSIAIIGTAPTALLALLDLVDAGAARPALIIGTPVGFVAAAESKAELAGRPIPFITVEGTRGGAAVAAAAANALLRLAVTSSDP